MRCFDWSHATPKKQGLVSCSYSLSQWDTDPATPKHLWSLSVWCWCPWVSTSSLLHLPFKWISPLQAEEGHVPEKSCVSTQTFKFLTAPKVLNMLSTHWKWKPLCISTASTHEHHRELRSMSQCAHGEEGGVERPSALLVAGDGIAELPQTQVALPVPKASMTSSAQGSCSSGGNIQSVRSMKCFWDCSSYVWGISQYLPVLFWTTTSRIPRQTCGHNWPSSSWKPVKKLVMTSPFLGACVRFCMSQGLNLHYEDFPPFSMAVMLNHMVTWIHTKLISYSVVILSKKIHWKCTNKNYNKGQLGYFFSYSHKEHLKRRIADWGTTPGGMRIIWGW